MDSQLIRPQLLPYASQSFQQESCHGDSLHFRFSKMGSCPKDIGAALKFFFCDFLTWDNVLDGHDEVILPCRLGK